MDERIGVINNGCIQSATDDVQFQRQIDLEKEMQENGFLSVQKSFTKSRLAEQEANTVYGSALLQRGVESLALAIKSFQAECATGNAGRKHSASKFIATIPDTNAVAFLALRQALNAITQRMSLSRMAMTISDTLQREAKLIEFKTQNPELYTRMTGIVKSRNEHHRFAAMSVAMSRNEIGFQPWSLNDRTQLGLKLIDLIIQSTGYLEITPIYNARTKQTINYVVATSKCSEWIKSCQTSALLTPEYLPTIIPPKGWTNPFDGGYYSKIKPLWLVKARFNPKNYLEELNNRVDEMSTVYRAINAIQNTAYHINEKVYDVMLTLWEQGGDRAKLTPRADYNLPPCPVCGEIFPEKSTTRKHACFADKSNIEEFKKWKDASEQVYRANIQLFSKKLQLSKILYLADKFKSEANIYFPCQLDFRGRVYPVPNFLQPQGTDWAKGLLEYADSKPLEDMQAVRWLAIHGANAFGNDKISLDERFCWVLENEDNIMRSADNSYDYKWWQDADKPFQFLAFCYEWSGYLKACNEGKTYHSKLPIAMDGTCNGLQIFSLLLRDEVGGRATNLLPAVTPQDIYKIVADKVIIKLQDRCKNGSKKVKKDTGEELYNEKLLAPLLLDLGINRKTTKRQVMTLPYGATYTSCKDYTHEWILEQQSDNPYHELFRVYPKTFHISLFLSELIWVAIHETVIAARDAMEYLQDLAGVVTKEQLPVTWTTPVGLPILQAYKETKSRRVRAELGGKVIKTNVTEETIQLNLSEQKNGISPNFIHSLDAAAMMKTVDIAMGNGVTNFTMIHDSYATHAADAAKLAISLRVAFVDLFSDDLLAKFRDDVSRLLPDDVVLKLPPPPNKGTLDINEVLKSEYFFA